MCHTCRLVTRLFSSSSLSSSSSSSFSSSSSCSVTETELVGCLLAKRPSNMQVYLRDGSAQTVLPAATLRCKLQTKLPISPSHSILTPGKPVPALAPQRQAPGRIATSMLIFKSLESQFPSHWYDSTPEKSRRKRDSKPGSSALETRTHTHTQTGRQKQSD